MKTKFILLTALFSVYSFSQINTAKFDSLVTVSLNTFHVPGMAVAIIKDGKIIHSKGYGISSIKTNNKVDENTLFGIASNSKAFTCAAISILIEQKKINWDDKVIQYLPNFKMYNDYVTEEFTIRDLLTHRSGLGLGAGDLMLFPKGVNFTVEEIIHNLRYLKATTSFRAQFDYDNLLYIVAGAIIEKVSGESWNQFIQKNIFSPLEMSTSHPEFGTIKDTLNTAAPHLYLDNKYSIANRDENPVMNAAGGIYSSIHDMEKWVLMLLNKGKIVKTGQNLLSEKQLNEMWSAQTILLANTYAPYNTHFKAYGLGWFLSDVKGFKQVTHTGGLEGMVSQVMLYPELNLGIIILTNQQTPAMYALTSIIVDSYLDIPFTNYIELYSKRNLSVNKEADKEANLVWNTIKNNKNQTTTILDKLVGKYRDAWFGEIEIYKKNSKFFFKSVRSPHLKGEVFYYKNNTYVVKWNDRKLNADAFIFSNNENKTTNLKMKAISSSTDFSYDFQDLNFYKVE